ncbi:MAG: response regulator transcription factor [Patescibacteria group bacterium]
MKILIVEDEHRIAGSIKKGLEQEKHLVDVAYDGEEGLDMASSGSFDVIILDLMLPKMDGLTVCKNLREEKIHTPVIILTAKGQIKDKVAGLNCGADDYLTKPFSFEELLARIKALSRRSSHEIKSTIVSHNDLTLDSESYKVMRSGKQIDLTSREFMLLEYLLKNQKRILTKDQIIDRVWNYDSDILPNTVEVYIKKLRDKIEVPFKGKLPIIKTVKGFGYKVGE